MLSQRNGIEWNGKNLPTEFGAIWNPISWRWCSTLSIIPHGRQWWSVCRLPTRCLSIASFTRTGWWILHPCRWQVTCTGTWPCWVQRRLLHRSFSQPRSCSKITSKVISAFNNKLINSCYYRLCRHWFVSLRNWRKLTRMSWYVPFIRISCLCRLCFSLPRSSFTLGFRNCAATPTVSFKFIFRLYEFEEMNFTVAFKKK